MGPVQWEPIPDDGNTAWMENLDAFMNKYIERGWDSPTGNEAYAAGLGLLDPPFEVEGDLEHGPMAERREKEWVKFKEAVLKDWKKRSDSHKRTLSGDALKEYEDKLEAREMPGLGDNAVAIAKTTLTYFPLQMRAIQFAEFRKKAEEQPPPSSA